MTKNEFLDWVKNDLWENIKQRWRKLKPQMWFYAWLLSLVFFAFLSMFLAAALFMETKNPWVFLMLAVLPFIYFIIRYESRHPRESPAAGHKHRENRYKVRCPECDFVFRVTTRVTLSADTEEAANFEVHCPRCEKRFPPKYFPYQK